MGPHDFIDLIAPGMLQHTDRHHLVELADDLAKIGIDHPQAFP